MPLTSVLRVILLAARNDRPALNVYRKELSHRALKLRMAAEKLGANGQAFLIHLNRATVKADGSEYPYS